MTKMVINILDILAVILDMCIMTFYFHVFFKRKKSSKFMIAAIYTIAFIMYLFSSLCLEMAYQRIIGYLCVCLFLSLAYAGPIIYKVVLTLCYSAAGVLVEDITGFAIVMLYGIAPALKTKSTYYLIGIIVSNCIFFILVICITLVWKKFFS